MPRIRSVTRDESRFLSINGLPVDVHVPSRDALVVDNVVVAVFDSEEGFLRQNVLGLSAEGEILWRLSRCPDWMVQVFMDSNGVVYLRGQAGGAFVLDVHSGTIVPVSESEISLPLIVGIFNRCIDPYPDVRQVISDEVG